MVNKDLNSAQTDDDLEKQLLIFNKMKRAVINEGRRIISRNSFNKSFKVKDVVKWLEFPEIYEKELRRVSVYFYHTSPQYRNMVSYLSQMATYSYTVIPHTAPSFLDKEKYINAFEKSVQYLDKMSIKNEFRKAYKVALREDYFYGYIYENKDSFFFKKLNPDFCRVIAINEGLLQFQFNFTYFIDNEKLLKDYPKEFMSKYYLLKHAEREDKEDYRWQTLSLNKTICLKVNEDILEYGLLPFGAVFEAIFDLDDYQKIKKSKTEMDSFMTLIQKIPFDDSGKTVGKMLMDPTMASLFHGLAEDSLPDNIGVITTPMKIEAIKTDQSRSSEDSTANAIRDVYNDFGVPQHLFNPDRASTTGMNLSIKKDEQNVFSFLNQIERWINHRIRNLDEEYRFKINLMHVTNFNKEKMLDMYIKAAQGAMQPIISEIAALVGLNPLDLLNKAKFENEVLDLHSILTPLKTSYTQSSKESEAGRKKKSDEDISDSTEINRENETDSNKDI